MLSEDKHILHRSVKDFMRKAGLKVLRRGSLFEEEFSKWYREVKRFVENLELKTKKKDK